MNVELRSFLTKHYENFRLTRVFITYDSFGRATRCIYVVSHCGGTRQGDLGPIFGTFFPGKIPGKIPRKIFP
jgi:hypothetical protein